MNHQVHVDCADVYFITYMRDLYQPVPTQFGHSNDYNLVTQKIRIQRLRVV